MKPDPQCQPSGFTSNLCLFNVLTGAVNHAAIYRRISDSNFQDVLVLIKESASILWQFSSPPLLLSNLIILMYVISICWPDLHIILDNWMRTDDWIRGGGVTDDWALYLPSKVNLTVCLGVASFCIFIYDQRTLLIWNVLMQFFNLWLPFRAQAAKNCRKIIWCLFLYLLQSQCENPVEKMWGNIKSDPWRPPQSWSWPVALFLECVHVLWARNRAAQDGWSRGKYLK